MRRITPIAVLLASTVSGCGEEAGIPARAPIAEAPAPTAQPKAEESYPSEGRVDARVMTERGVVRKLEANELEHIAGCHRQGKPLGWVMLRVHFDSGTTTPTAELVERKAVSKGTAECLRAGVQEGYAGTDGLSTVLIYARLL